MALYTDFLLIVLGKGFEVDKPHSWVNVAPTSEF